MEIEIYSCIRCGATYNGDYIKWNRVWHEGHARDVDSDEAVCLCCGESDGVKRYTGISLSEYPCAKHLG